MLDKEKAREKLKKLVSSIPAHADYNEENLKFQYLDPLLIEVLGWDRKDIVKEQQILKGRADYVLKIGNEEVMVIEAKRPSASLGGDAGRQAVSYAYHRKIKFAVLTNFKEIKVYHALSNIKNIDNNLLKFEDGGYFRFTFDNFLENFDKLLLLSKNSLEKHELNTLLSKKDERAAKPVDTSILLDLLQIRDWLSKDLKKLRMDLTKEQIDEAVQILIDRFIFMRSVEDRGLEGRNFLLGIIKDFNEGRIRKRLWDAMREQFNIFDQKYNSKLFFKGILESEEIFFDDETIKNTIRALYFGTKDQQARYMFNEIPGDLLGSIYEQYLGTVLEGTEKRVRLDLESGKRKKMGIYYTPSYIVDYIVKNTVGEYLQSKTIDEILEVKILDPACGSGSFIVRAFQEFCQAIEERLKQGEKPQKWKTFDHYKERLTLNQKATILESCIFGVDLDEKAVELARLNLLLKLLEDETHETRRRILPNMGKNIQEGNSLIDDYKVSEKAFNWNSREKFGEIMKDGGFDVVIGNPPYVFGGGIGISTKEKEFFKKKYTSGTRKLNLFSLFIEQSISLLKNEGFLSFILPNTFLRVTSYEDIRKSILATTKILKINNMHAGVFEGVTASTIILILNKEKEQKIRETNNVKIFEGLNDNYVSKPQIAFKRKLHIFDLGFSELNDKILDKLEKDSTNLGSICKELIFGVVITKNIKEVVSKKKLDNRYKKFLEGRDIERYRINFSDKFLLYEKSKLHRARTPEIFEAKEKILVQRISGGKKPLKAAYDNEKYYNKESINNIIIADERFNIKYILALLNSNLINWFYALKFTNLSTLTVNVSKAYLSEIPIKDISGNEQIKIITLVDEMLNFKKEILEDNLIGKEKERIERRIKDTDYKIDQEIYNLYSLTKDEIKTVEESLK